MCEMFWRVILSYGVIGTSYNWEERRKMREECGVVSTIEFYDI